MNSNEFLKDELFTFNNCQSFTLSFPFWISDFIGGRERYNPIALKKSNLAWISKPRAQYPSIITTFTFYAHFIILFKGPGLSRKWSAIYGRSICPGDLGACLAPHSRRGILEFLKLFYQKLWALPFFGILIYFQIEHLPICQIVPYNQFLPNAWDKSWHVLFLIFCPRYNLFVLSLSNKMKLC